MIILADSEGPDETADAQTDVSLNCSHMPEDMFSHGFSNLTFEHLFFISAYKIKKQTKKRTCVQHN